MRSIKNRNGRRAFISNGAFTIVGFLALSPRVRSASALSALLKSDTIPTLTGSVGADKLGITLMHEHVLPVFGKIPDNLRDESISTAVRLLNKAKQAGVNTLVDVSPYRDIQLYQDISKRTDINIIVSTGYYLYESTSAVYQQQTELQMEDRMHKEVTEGIGGTKICAGIIKVAAGSAQLTPWEQKVFRAAARVQKATGVPIATHACEGALEQFNLLVQNGADPNHINFAHIESEFGWGGRTREQIAERFLPIVRGGGYLLFNNFSCEFYTKWENMVYLMRYYCNKGYTNRILISEDCNWEWKNGLQIFEAQEKHPDAAKRTYAYMLTHEVPKMKQSGFTDKEIETFMVDNSREYFQSGNK